LIYSTEDPKRRKKREEVAPTLQLGAAHLAEGEGAPPKTLALKLHRPSTLSPSKRLAR
jgi:hypothetical protein